MSTRAVTVRESSTDEAIPEALTELLEELFCVHCKQAISRYEMAAIWPAGDFVAHLHCWAQSCEGRA
jgi:hypothetical protein